MKGDRLLVVHKMSVWICDNKRPPMLFLCAGLSDINLNKNQMRISAYLKESRPIIDFVPGCMIEVGFIECGPINDFVNTKIILRMTQCQISDLVIPQLTSFYTEDEMIIVTAIISGGIEILWDNM
jgi:hypothetical protein